jgi:hypothetical protein
MEGQVGLEGNDRIRELFGKKPLAVEQLRIRGELEERDRRIASMPFIGDNEAGEILECSAKKDVDGLMEAVMEEALPILEGLTNGCDAEAYGIRDERMRIDQESENANYANLRNLFFTKEGSTARGNTSYLSDSITKGISDLIKSLQKEKKKWIKSYGPQEDENSWKRWQEDKRKELHAYLVSLEHAKLEELYKGQVGGDETSFGSEEDLIETLVEALIKSERSRIERIDSDIDRLNALKLHVDSRMLMDRVFIERQYVAHDIDAQAKIDETLGAGIHKPDSGHWYGFYQVDREWGDAVDRVEREIIETAKRFYPDGSGFFTRNPNNKEFKEWVNRLAKASMIDGVKRIDVMLAAWRQVCIKELTGKFSMSIGPKGEIQFNATPPLVSEYSDWIHNAEPHRAAEFGWSWKTYQAARRSDWTGQLGDSERVSPFRIASKSGHPAGIGHVLEVSRFGNFMDFCELKGGKNNGRSLWDVWQGYDGKPGLSQADLNFPWVDTDASNEKTDSGTGPDEAPPGSFSLWLVRRGQVAAILRSCQTVPDLNKLDSISTNFDLRVWIKLGLVRPGEFMGNPVYAKILSDICWGLGLDTNAIGKLLKGQDKDVNELMFGGTNPRKPNEVLVGTEPGGNFPSFLPYIRHALYAGVISAEEYELLSGLRYGDPKTVKAARRVV